MNLADTVNSLIAGKNVNEIAKKYGLMKGDQYPKRADFYRATILRIIKDPNNCNWLTLKYFFEACGVDIEKAVAIAASSQIKEQ